MEEGQERHSRYGQSPRADDLQGKSAFWEWRREAGHVGVAGARLESVLGQVSDSPECWTMNTFHQLLNILKYSSNLLLGI